MEDLFQVGCIGLLKAIDKFDDSFEVQFSTYAVPMIMGEIKRFLRDDGMVKVSRTIKENGWKIKKIQQDINRIKGREATVGEIAQAIGLSEEEVVMTMEAGLEVESLYKTVYENDGNEICLADQLSASSDQQIEEKLVLKKLLGNLNGREKIIIDLRYFKNKTQSQVAEYLGISQVQVSRIEKKILKNLRENME